MKILVVENNPSLISKAKKTLKNTVSEIVIAKSHQEAKKLINFNKFDFILYGSDVQSFS